MAREKSREEREYRRRFYRQLALDCCCSPEEAEGQDNQFHVYRPLEGRRRFWSQEPCYLKALSVRGKILLTGREDIVSWCRDRFGKEPGPWFMEPPRMRELGDRTLQDGFRIGMLHPFYVSFRPGPDPGAVLRERGLEVRLFRDKEIEAFRGDDRFTNAYSFCPEAPDRIGAAAVRDGNILAMAGASEDSPEFWQIGIDVTKEARGQGLGVLLTSLLRDEILAMGHVPYYGAAVSHTISQNIAIRSGFILGWTELTTERIPD